MGPTLEALRRLQTIEHELVEVRRRLRSRSAAVAAQAGRIEELRQQHQALHDDHLHRQQRAAAVELELKSRDEDAARLRRNLNTARTNKEYAAILTHINTIKADSSRLEDEALKLIQDAEQVQQQAKMVLQQVAEAERVLEDVRKTSTEEVERLDRRMAELQEKRQAAAGDVPGEALSAFQRIAALRDGDVMAPIETVGDRPPFEYVCGGCNMAITAEHANALRTRDEVRYCDLCGRILYLDEGGEASGAEV